MTTARRLQLVTSALPIYVILSTTPWPVGLNDDLEWSVDNEPFDVLLVTYDQIAVGVKMVVPVHVEQYRRTRRSRDPRNPGPEYEFEGTATFPDGNVAKVYGTLNCSTGMGAFDDVTP